MQEKYYLYRFLDDNKNVLYIGRTNNIYRRIVTEHFTTNTHLRNECYFQTKSVEFAEFDNESEQVAYEAILINKEKPRYNTQFKDSAQFYITLPKIEWLPFKWDFEGQMEIMKAMKNGTISATDALLQIYEKLGNQVPVRNASWGFDDIDKMSILASGTTALIAGESETYKTTYGLKILLANAKNNKKVLYVNLKDSIEFVMQKLISVGAFIDVFDLQSNNLTTENWENLSTTFDESLVSNIDFYNMAELGNDLDSIVNFINKSCYDLCIIDDVNSIADFEKSYDNDKNIVAMSMIKQAAINNRCSIIILYSLHSKEMRTRQSKRPSMYDIPNNSLWSYSDVVQFTYEQIGNEDFVSGAKIVELITAKNNLGRTGTVVLSAINGNLFPIETQTE